MKNTDLDLILPVRKPAGSSTYDLIRAFKRAAGFQGKIGHGGTLDPFASGVVLLLLERATGRFEEIRTWEKVYQAGLRLGAVSSTGDPQGTISAVETAGSFRGGRKKILPILEKFTGRFEQKIPAYSAAQSGGERLYRLARAGQPVEKSKPVEIRRLEMVAWRWPLLTLRVTCLGGVYIRQLAEDIGNEMGCGAYLYFLERERVGQYTLKECLEPEEFSRFDRFRPKYPPAPGTTR
ncbi:MAG TPA: tRNA pseudouridine(55) synthase TruB [bacterium]|uniref:tRNA pseudouridine(55) synthase n=1 Tax=candidate division TA06 bacterium ADurb.Bin417 TaxID=1852828 RepID=A0A1V5MGG5_UNCT6|nr:MAG: tRNA pseudouridine synthase B [candidate division TA06 bacterium ADurb.Bin417]HNQ35427.1 tRNA pseudouridine(55) synthase TruB [bacterium]HNS49008.1 tRNA pseudouridine(55) synthase TruB [bacterium]